MKKENTDYTDEIFNAMVGGTEADRVRANSKLEGEDFDRERLRILIVDELKKQIYDTTGKKEGDPNAWSKAWLLSTLGRVADDEVESNKVLKNHVNKKNETHPWIRYWTLEGLYNSGNKNLPLLIPDIIDKDDHPLVIMLAKAIHAEGRGGKSLEDIKTGLGPTSDKKIQWFALRALRIVPLQGTVDLICNIIDEEFPGKVEIIRDPEKPIISYDAIGALGHIPSDFRCQEITGETVIRVIKNTSSSPMYDNIRRKALKVLGKLRYEKAEYTVREQLTDDNPAIVREAAWTMEKTFETSRAVTHILQVAVSADPKHVEKYASALREMNRKVVIDVLENHLITGPIEDRQTVEHLLVAIGGAAAFATLQVRKDVMMDYEEMFSIAERNIDTYYTTSFSSAKEGFNIVTTMDQIMFGLGVGLIIVSAIIALISEGSLDSWTGVATTTVTGGGGILLVLVTRFYKDPRENVEKSVDHMMRLSLIFFAYHRQLSLVSQGYTRALLENKPLTIDEIEGYQATIAKIMTEAIDHMKEFSS